MTPHISRFPIHDELTAPEGSQPVLHGALSGAGQLPNVLAVLAGSPAALRAYARFRGELRHGELPLATRERIALAVAEHHRCEPGIVLHARLARGAGLGLDEIALARTWDSREPADAALLAYLRALVVENAQPPMHVHEAVHEAGFTDAQMLEALACVALETLTALVNVAGDVPVDGSREESRLEHLRAA